MCSSAHCRPPCLRNCPAEGSEGMVRPGGDDMETGKARRWSGVLLTVLAVAAGLVSLGGAVAFAEACKPPFRVADLSLSGSTAPDGSNMNYTLVVTNNGPDCAASVATTTELAPGSTFVGVVDSDPKSWLCSGTTVVRCRLTATLPSPPGKNVAFVTLAATAPSPPEDATVHSVVESKARDDFPTDNEIWQTFGRNAEAGEASGKHPAAALTRPDSQSIAVNLLDISGFPPPPPGRSFQTDRVILVETPAAPGQSKDQALKLVIKFRAQSEPDAIVFLLDHGSNTWDVVSERCGDNGPFPCIDGVSFTTNGIATITVLTLHFSHYGR
jgi:hypothetical protein